MKIIIIIGMLFSFLSAEDYTPEGFITMAKGLGWTSENCSIGVAVVSTLDYQEISLRNALHALKQNDDTNVSKIEYDLVLHGNLGSYFLSAACRKQHSK